MLRCHNFGIERGLFIFMKSNIFIDLFADFLCVVGVGLLGYGLYLYEPWISFTVVGAILLLIGLFSALRG